MQDALRYLMILVFAGVLAGCNTVDGAGEDIQAGGEAVSDTAQDVQDEID